MLVLRQGVKCLAVALLLAALASSTTTVVLNAVAAYNQHQPIRIDSNGGFTAANGVNGGKGTRSNPYVIEGWEVDSGPSDGIHIEHTDAYFVIRNVFVHSSDPNNSTGSGVHLFDVQNARVENSTVSENYQGIFLENVTNAAVVDSNATSNGYGMGLYVVSDVVIERNRISFTAEDALSGELTTNVTIESNWISHQHRGILFTHSTFLQIRANEISFSFHPVFDCYCPAVSLPYVTDTVISTNTIYSNNIGVLQDYPASNLSIVDNTIVGNFGPGIIGAADNMTIMRNNVSWNGGTGISAGSFGERIEDNHVAFNNGDGVFIGGDRDVVSNNVITGNTGYGIELLRATNTTLHGNNLTENGIYLHGDFDPSPPLSNYNSHTITPDNLVNGWPLYYYKNCVGLAVDGIPVGELIIANCTGVRLSNLTMRPMEIGVEMAFVHNVTFSGNRIRGSRWEGIQIMAADNLTIARNEISSNTFHGIEVTNAAQVAVEGNEFSGNGRPTGGAGVLVAGKDLSVISNNMTDNAVGLETGGSNITIETNNISRNLYGMFICCNSVRIVGNTISSNTVIGLNLQVTDALVYHNSFFDNGAQAGALNSYRYSLDNGYPSGGNYWSDYKGSDDCHGPNQGQCPGPDGIGDSPYALVDSGADRYPLMNPWGAADWAPAPSFTISPSSGTASTTFKVDASPSWDREDPVASLEVRWDWQDDGTWDTSWSQNKTAEHQYPLSGTYTIRLAVRDTQGLTREMTKEVAVVEPLSLSVAATPQEGFAPFSVAFYANITGGLAPYTYDWSFGDGTASSLPSLTHVYGESGNYSATLVVTDSQGMQQSTTVTIKVRPPATASPAPKPETGIPPWVYYVVVVVAAGILGLVTLAAIQIRRHRRLPPRPPSDQTR